MSALHATATVQYTGPGRLRACGYYAVEYWIVRDGVVVGTTVQANDAFSVVDLGAGAPLLFTDEGRVLTSCVADSELPLTSGDPLPAGEYTVYPRVAPVRADGVGPPPRPSSCRTRHRAGTR